MADENQPQAPKKGLGAVLGEAKEGARALKEKVPTARLNSASGFSRL